MENEQIEVIKHIFSLLPTLEEGIIYIKECDKENGFEAYKIVLESCSNAVDSIKKAVGPILSDLPENKIEEKCNSIRTVLDGLLMDLSQNKERAKVEEIIECELIPAYNNWEEEMLRCLG